MATVRDQDLTFFTNDLLEALTSDSVIASLLANAITFTDVKGAYEPGSSVNISVADKSNATTITTDFSTNPDLAFTKGTLTNFPVSLDAYVQTEIKSDELDRTLSSGNKSMINALIRQRAMDHLEVIENDLYTRTFNLASLDANVVGTSATAFTIDDLIDLEEGIFRTEKWNGDIYLVLPPTKIAQIKKDFNNRYTAYTPTDGPLSLRGGFFLNDAPSVKIFVSTELPTPDEMSNITGTETIKMGFAFASQSVAMFNPSLPDERELAIGLDVRNENKAGVNFQITQGSIGTKRFNEHFTKMSSLYGTGIFRPSLVIPVKGGGII